MQFNWVCFGLISILLHLNFTLIFSMFDIGEFCMGIYFRQIFSNPALFVFFCD